SLHYLHTCHTYQLICICSFHSTSTAASIPNSSVRIMRIQNRLSSCLQRWEIAPNIPIQLHLDKMLNITFLPVASNQSFSFNIFHFTSAYPIKVLSRF